MRRRRWAATMRASAASVGMQAAMGFLSGSGHICSNQWRLKIQCKGCEDHSGGSHAAGVKWASDAVRVDAEVFYLKTGVLKRRWISWWGERRTDEQLSRCTHIGSHSLRT